MLIACSSHSCLSARARRVLKQHCCRKDDRKYDRVVHDRLWKLPTEWQWVGLLVTPNVLTLTRLCFCRAVLCPAGLCCAATGWGAAAVHGCVWEAPGRHQVLGPRQNVPFFTPHEVRHHLGRGAGRPVFGPVRWALFLGPGCTRADFAVTGSTTRARSGQL